VLKVLEPLSKARRQAVTSLTRKYRGGSQIRRPFEGDGNHWSTAATLTAHDDGVTAAATTCDENDGSGDGGGGSGEGHGH
jgi:hypothetical protein